MLLSVVAAPIYIPFCLETRHLQTLFFVVDPHTHTSGVTHPCSRMSACTSRWVGPWGNPCITGKPVGIDFSLPFKRPSPLKCKHSRSLSSNFNNSSVKTLGTLSLA